MVDACPRPAAAPPAAPRPCRAGRRRDVAGQIRGADGQDPGDARRLADPPHAVRAAGAHRLPAIQPARAGAHAARAEMGGDRRQRLGLRRRPARPARPVRPTWTATRRCCSPTRPWRTCAPSSATRSTTPAATTTHVLYLASRESRDTVHVVSRVGRRLPAHMTALGQALLADLTTDEVDDAAAGRPWTATRRTPSPTGRRCTTSWTRSAQRGWAFEREQGTEGVACVAAAVAYRIPATDAISCSMPAELAKGRARAGGRAVCRHTTPSPRRCAARASAELQRCLRRPPEGHVAPGAADPVQHGVGGEVRLAELGDDLLGVLLGVVLGP